MLDALAVAGEWFGAIEFVDGGIERAMGVMQFRGHYVGVVKVRHRCLGEVGAGIEDLLREIEDSGALAIIGIRPGEGVVDDADRVAVTAFKPPADVTEARHVHARGENAEVEEVGVEKHEYQIAWNGRRLKPADGYVVSALGADLRNYKERAVGDHGDV